MVNPNLKSYRVNVVSLGVISADVIVEAISAEDAAEIAKASVKPEDFEVVSVDTVSSIETLEL